MRYTQNLRIDGNKVISYTTHVATIQGSKLLLHGYWSVTTSKHVNHVAREMGLQIVKDAPKTEPENSKDDMLKTVSMIASLASVFTKTPAESNDWKLRMMKAGLSNRGLNVPEDWNTLPEAEKTRRLDGALAAIA